MESRILDFQSNKIIRTKKKCGLERKGFEGTDSKLLLLNISNSHNCSLIECPINQKNSRVKRFVFLSPRAGCIVKKVFFNLSPTSHAQLTRDASHYLRDNSISSG